MGSCASVLAVRLLEHTLERKQDSVADTPLLTGRPPGILVLVLGGLSVLSSVSRQMSTPRLVLQGFATLKTVEGLDQDF